MRLHLASEVTPLWEATEALAAGDRLPPPYWAFAWAGGQALARHLLDHPGSCAGRRVLDFGAGSGLVAIAAARAGAARVERRRDRPLRRAAIALNAAPTPPRRVPSAADRHGRAAEGFDVVLAATCATSGRSPSGSPRGCATSPARRRRC
jgi:predicted nicotinamide N-methyase